MANQPGSTKGQINPFIIFYPLEKDVRSAQQGDGPAAPTPAAETIKAKGKATSRRTMSEEKNKPFDHAKYAKALRKAAAHQFPNSAKETIARAEKHEKLAKELKEETAEEKLYRYLHKRRMNWVYRIDESTSVKQFSKMLQEFINYASAYLNLKTVPSIILKSQLEDNNSFAVWSNEGIEIGVANRHPMDVFRSVGHELVHQKQHEDDVLHSESGKTGSDHENEANALAGIMMRNYAKQNPDLFNLEYISEGGLLDAMFGDSKKKSPKTSKDTSKIATQMARDKQKHEFRMKEIAARNSSKQVRKRVSEPEELQYPDPDSETYKHFHNPERDAKVERIKAWHQKYPRVDRQAAHQNWLAQNKKFPIRKSKAGKKPFSDILKLKEAIALMNKSIKSNIDYGILQEVFYRGIEDWDENSGISIKESAFNRVNSYIAKGKAYKLDEDLR